MKRVRMIGNHGNLFTGDLAAFPDSEADSLVEAGKAEFCPQGTGAPVVTVPGFQDTLEAAGIDEPVIAVLVEAGIDSVEALQEATDDQLIDLPRIGKKTAERLREAVS